MFSFSKVCMPPLISAILILSVSGCSDTRIPGIYRMDVRQGNYIHEDTMNLLRIGMKKSKVQELFGSPAITHVLNKDRWDYYYSFEPGRAKNGEHVVRKLSIYFKNDVVVGWE